MKAEALKRQQAVLKAAYLASPATAIQTLSARGTVDFASLAFELVEPASIRPAGLHVGSGGDGTFACPVEIMLAGWISCFGVTLAAVAHAMKLEIFDCDIIGQGTIDFAGTLAVNKKSPVGLTETKIMLRIATDESQDAIDKLIDLTERYCVVHQTFMTVSKSQIELQIGEKR